VCVPTFSSGTGTIYNHLSPTMHINSCLRYCFSSNLCIRHALTTLLDVSRIVNFEHKLPIHSAIVIVGKTVKLLFSSCDGMSDII
jgi:hypothetical protein